MNAEISVNSVPDVSVVVVNWNRRELLMACLGSLLLQEGTSFEIIVVDNGSTDGSVDAVEELAANVKIPIKLIRNSVNYGFCRANNQGIHAARGEYIALLNNDAEAQHGWLAALMRAIGNRQRVGMVAAKILVYEDSARIDKVGHLIWPDGQNRGRGTGEIDTGQYDSEENVLWPDGCAALYRKSMLDQIGGFDEELFAYGDDAELGLRARIAGWECVYTPEAVVRHHRGATLGVLSSRRLELIERNRILLAIKHFPVPLLLLNIPWSLARIGAGVSAALRGHGEAGRFTGFREKARMGFALLRGFGAGMALIPHTWKKRRAFDPQRRLTSRQVQKLLFQHKISLKALSEAAV